MADERMDTERVGQFVDGPYDTDVTLFRPDIVSLMGRDGPVKDDPLRLGGGFPVCPGHKLKAATNDWVFSPFLYLWEEEPYEDPGAWRRKYRQEQAQSNISEQPFLSTVGERTMNGLGTYYGTFISEMVSVLNFETKRPHRSMKVYQTFTLIRGRKEQAMDTSG